MGGEGRPHPLDEWSWTFDNSRVVRVFLWRRRRCSFFRLGSVHRIDCLTVSGPMWTHAHAHRHALLSLSLSLFPTSASSVGMHSHNGRRLSGEFGEFLIAK